MSAYYLSKRREEEEAQRRAVREQVAAKNDALRAQEAQMREQAKVQNYLQGKAMLEAALKDSNLSDAEKADIKEHAKTNGMAAGLNLTAAAVANQQQAKPEIERFGLGKPLLKPVAQQIEEDNTCPPSLFPGLYLDHPIPYSGKIPDCLIAQLVERGASKQLLENVTLEIYDRWQPDKKGRGYIAGTFQNTISWNLDYLYLIDAPSPTDTLVHELVHVRQYRDRGVFELLFTGFQYQLWEIMGWDTHDRNTGVWAERDAFSCQEHFLNGGNLSEPPCSLGDK
jgi:hypothetical protein